MTIIIANPNSTAAMTDAMVEAARIADPSLQFEGWTSHDGPPAIQGVEEGEAATGPLLKLVDKAEADDASGLIIGCFDDTALAEASTRASFPVLGIGQAAFHACALRQMRFSVVTTLPVSVPIIEGNIHTYGLGGFLGKVRASNVPVLELERAPANASESILREAQTALAQDSIDAIVLGCAGMVTLTQHLRAELPCAVIDPLEAAVGCMGWLAHHP